MKPRSSWSIFNSAPRLVHRFVRRPADQRHRLEPSWVRQEGLLDGADAVVHLAGAGIGEGRWTAERKRRILDSRVQSTVAVAEAFATTPRRPRVLLQASAVGYYGSRGDETRA